MGWLGSLARHAEHYFLFHDPQPLLQVQLPHNPAKSGYLRSLIGLGLGKKKKSGMYGKATWSRVQRCSLSSVFYLGLCGHSWAWRVCASTLLLLTALNTPISHVYIQHTPFQILIFLHTGLGLDWITEITILRIRVYLLERLMPSYLRFNTITLTHNMCVHDNWTF